MTALWTGSMPATKPAVKKLDSPTVTMSRTSDCTQIVTHVVMQLNGRPTRPVTGWVDEFEYETTRG